MKIQLYKKILKYLKNKTFLNMVIVFSSNIIASGLNFIFQMIAARKLGLTAFGSFAYITDLIGLFTSLTDLGITTGFIRYYALYQKSNNEKAFYLLKITFKLRIIVSVVSFFILNISAFIFSTNNTEISMVTIFIGSFEILTVTFHTFFIAIQQSTEDFKNYALTKIIPRVAGMILLCVLLIFTAYFSINNLLLIISITPIIGVFFAIRTSRFSFKSFSKKNILQEKELFKEIFHFSKWVMVSIFTVSFITRLDTLMLKQLSTAVELGYYSAAKKIALVLPIITSTLTTVFLPKASKIENRKEFKNYIRKSFFISIIIIIPLFIAILFSRFIILAILDKEFIGAVPILQFLLMTYIIGILLNPLSLLFYNLNKPKLLAIMNIAQLIINYSGNLLLIPAFGGNGAILSTLAARIIGLFIIGISLIYFIKKKALFNENA